MLRNYLIVTVRSLLKNKVFAGINILGLALGITSSFLVFIYINYHNSFDEQYKESNTYRVLTDTYTTDNQFVRQFAFSLHFLAPEVKKSFPAVESAVRMFEFETLLMYYNNDIFFNKTVIGVDSNAIKFFGFKMLSGDADKALIEPRTAVITKSIAKLIFGNENPIGKTLGLGYGFHDPWPYRITGVMEDLPVNTHLRVDVLTSAIGSNSDMGLYSIFSGGDPLYYYPMFDTYITLKAGTNVEDFEKKLNLFLKEKTGRIMANYGKRELHLQHVKDIHLRKNIHPNYLGGMERRSLSRANEIDQRTINWIFYGAVILLLFSIFNYINLTYLNAVKRTKEIGLRKIFGAGLGKLFMQFFIESFILTLCATIIALIFIAALYQPFHNFLDLPDSLSLLSDYKVYVFFVLFLLGVVCVKSFLLFLILLSADVIKLQRSDAAETRKGGSMRRILLVGQLVVSFILIGGTLLLGKQINFFLDKDLGFDKENLLVIRKYTMATGMESIDLSYLKAFKEELKKSNDIEKTCLSTITPGFFYNTSQRVWANERKTFQANTIYLDHDYVDVYKLKLLAGRFYTDNFANEQSNVVVNRKMAGMLGFNSPAEAIGQTVFISDENAHHVAPGAKKIIGVLEDFYQEPLTNAIAPIKFHLFDTNRGFYTIRLRKGANVQNTVNHVKTVFAKFYPKDNLDYYFLDDFLKDQYKSEGQIKKIMQIYTYTSILIAYLGLLAFSVYLIKVRKKSIAMRKVLGATTSNVTMLLLREYVKMLIISFVIAIPLALVIVYQLFQSYAYRTSIGWVAFFITGLLLSVVVVGTIATQALKATVESPVKSLRRE
jgi:putative ABC transport system permease protein